MKLGRLFQKDERDKEYLIRSLFSQKPTRRVFRYWQNDGWWGDQGDTPQCVAYAWCHWLEDGPIEQIGLPPCIEPSVLYEEAQKVDSIPGEDYEGTTVRAGAKVLQARGFIQEYRWLDTRKKGQGLKDLVRTILEEGPVVMGTNWYASMDEVQSNEQLVLKGKTPVGGHAYLINAVNTKLQLFRAKNSWKRSWGIDGHAYIPFSMMERLIYEEGEGCLAVEISK